ncbi:tetratricopeptide repeat protein 30A2 [Striga asiatica]|uniref:Tetratricopeptide repeat protein 30A2 n=1 Tax=Striga asiatica TaxID=4170 RepID=A0A5A7PV80_STRAF|nr:tetratricopeptide repeat protein 30A2 [Striga asiatica]
MAQISKLVQAEPIVGNNLITLVNVLQVVLENLEPMQLLLDPTIEKSRARAKIERESKTRPERNSSLGDDGKAMIGWVGIVFGRGFYRCGIERVEMWPNEKLFNLRKKSSGA